MRSFATVSPSDSQKPSQDGPESRPALSLTYKGRLAANRDVKRPNRVYNLTPEGSEELRRHE